MASESGPLTGFVALCAADLKAFNDSGELRPDIFCAPGVFGRYIPLDPTVEGAIETALMQSTTASYEVAECDTKWYLLKVSLSAEAIVALFLKKELSWGEKLHRMRLLTSITVEWLLKTQDSLPQVELIEVPLSQMSMDDWGDRVLKTKLPVCGACQQCSEPDRSLWKATNKGGGGYYCAKCWHAHGKKTACGSLHELEQVRKSLRKGKAKTAEAEDVEASNASPESPAEITLESLQID